MAIAPVDPNANAIRYTTLEAVKARLGIESTDTSRDAQVTEATIAGEVQIDQHLGRAFPDIEPDPVITIVPAPIAQVALSVAVGIYSSASAPFGTAGSDTWALGAVSVPEIVRTEVQRNPLLTGYAVSWGVA